ncbi:MAG: hydroxysqualene dehydroxylase, partial [Polyangiaceae bacterium]
APLPGEHGFRFFPRFYKHVVDTMGRIPYGGGSVAQNLVDTTQLYVGRFGRPPLVLPPRFPHDVGDLQTALLLVVAAISGQIEVPLDEVVFFAQKMWQFVTSCQERRNLDYERVNWWDFIEADGRSDGYQKYFGNGITRSLVAAKARRASTKTIGDIFVQIVFDILQPGVSADRVLNGPTSDVWINPWLAYLRQRGVVYHLESELRAIHYERGAVRGATVASGDHERKVEADYYVAALPVERMAALVTPELLRGDPSLANLDELTEYVEWMNGIQFYLTEDVPVARGHAILVDSPWALTTISQAQFWDRFDLTSYADGRVRGLLSVDISDWDVAGLNGKQAQNCTRDEIATEVWAQLKQSVNGGGQDVLRDDHLHSWFLDPDIGLIDPSRPDREGNAEPLLVNYVDTWRLRPEAVTRIPNFFLASDYVRTYTDLATMEGANEAARRAVNGILRAARPDAAPCEIWDLQEPEVFLPLRAYDRIRFRKGLPWDDTPMVAARSAMGFLGQGTPRPAAPRSPSPAAETAAAARGSSDMGLQRLRIMGEQ